MFQNLFSTSPLVWTGLIAGMVALPVLIHLINMLRHKRVKWAAMDFLLQSYKRQRNWIWLKQLLLLLSRIALLLLALFTLANIGCDNKYAAGLLGGRTTHHYVLLDDSFSMSDQASSESVFDHARQTVQTIAARAAAKQNQRFTLVTFSSAANYSFDANADAQSLTEAQVSEMEGGLSSVAVINGAQIDSAFLDTLQERRSELSVSQLSVSAIPAVSLVRQLISQRNTEDAEVHILSDFRSRDWEQATELNRQVEDLPGEARVHFIRCTETERANAAIVELKSIRNTRAAGVPLVCELAVKNFSDTSITNLSVEVVSRMFDDSATLSGNLAGADLTSPAIDETALPPVFFESIAPGETATQRFSVFFAKPGSHIIRAKLPEDSVMTDNTRRIVIETADVSRVLLVDDSRQQHAYYISSAFEPGGNRKTGIATQTVAPDFFRTVTEDELNQFAAIYLLDVERFDEVARRKLVAYVSQGGGIAFFLGSKVSVAHYNDFLYRQGEGIFPLPLERTLTLPEETATGTADVLPEDHPIFAPLQGTGGTLLDLVQLETVMRPTADWASSDSDSTDANVRVAAWVRHKGETPLVVEKSFGNGRVVAVMTTAAPIWHNWNKNPTFVVMLLEMQDFLAAGGANSRSVEVGDAIREVVDAKSIRSKGFVTFPIDAENTRDQQTLDATEIESELLFQFGSVDEGSVGTKRQGYYELFLESSSTGVAPRVIRVAANVDLTEGDLKLTETQQLANQFSLASPIVTTWSQLDPDPYSNTATQLSRILLLILVLLLFAEQFLAYALSYHPKRSARKSKPSDRPSESAVSPALSASGRTDA